MNRALIFAHFDKDGLVDPYVIHALTVYRQYFSLVVFVTVSDLSESEVDKLKFLADRVIQRENYGYDFGSWRVGFEGVDHPELFSEIIFANDSCYGPLSDFESFLRKSEDLNAAVWGATLSHQFVPHVQSYFMAFRREIIRSGFAKRFWASVEHKENKQDIIWEYEIGLSQQAVSEGYKIDAVVNFDKENARCFDSMIAEYNALISPNVLRAEDYVDTPSVNPTQFYWVQSFKMGSPFVKIELLRDNPPSVPLKSVEILTRSNKRFDLWLIDQHLKRVAPSAKWFLR
ncbi:MAG: rhamnan synthesis F family protein [Hyphomonadaceae bacterium]